MQVLADLRLACRALLKRPAFTGLAVATLALAIGANATLFGFADAAAFRPLPVREPGRLVALLATRDDGPVMGFSYPDFRDLARELPGLQGTAAFTEQPVSLAREGGDAVLAWASLVSEGYFPVLGLAAERGRLFAPAEAGREGHGGEAVVVLSHRCFVSRFGGDPGLVGQTVQLNGHPFTVVGVAPEGFVGTRLLSYAPDLWVPIAQHAAVIPGSEGMLERRAAGSFHLLARLAPGADRARVQAAAAGAAARLAAAYPETRARRDGVRLFSNRTAINPWMGSPGRVRGIAGLALAGVGLVLLVACANVANLLLAHASGRRRELAVRAALGAGRWRLARQLLAESAVLATAGGAAGLLLGAWATRLAPALLPEMQYHLSFEPQLDLRVAFFTLAVSLLAALLFGAAPAWRAGDADPADELRGGARGDGRRVGRLRQGLVVAQVAFSLLVLATAGLFVRSLAGARQLDLGFDPDGALVFGVDPALQGYTPEQAADLQRRLAAAVEGQPGVTALTWADDLPLDGNSSGVPIAEEGRTTREEQVHAFYQTVERGYFTTLGIALRTGRGFLPADRDRTTEAVVVSEALARALWPHGQPLGRRVVIGSGGGAAYEVVGVVADVKLNWLGEQPQPAIYFDLERNPTSRVLFVARHAGDGAALARAVRARLRALDPRLLLLTPRSLRDHAAPAFAGAQDGARLASTFGLLALVLACCGIYGVVAYGVAQRQRELAIRVAVGASPRAVVAAVVGGTLGMLGIGVGLGLAGALGVGQLLRGLLYGVSPADPLVLLVVTCGFAAVAWLASWLPVRRALALDPVRGLRSE